MIAENLSQNQQYLLPEFSISPVPSTHEIPHTNGVVVPFQRRMRPDAQIALRMNYLEELSSLTQLQEEGVTRELESPEIEKAYLFAREAHRGQIRKGDGDPYIVHPARVMLTAVYAARTQNLDTDHVGTVALLHDVKEDCGISIDEISSRFGINVARDVDLLSEQNKWESWEIRKEQAVKKIPMMGFGAHLVKSADFIDNITSVADLWIKGGEDALKNFNRGIDKQFSNYRAVHDALVKNWKTSPLVPKLDWAYGNLYQLWKNEPQIAPLLTFSQR